MHTTSSFTLQTLHVYSSDAWIVPDKRQHPSKDVVTSPHEGASDTVVSNLRVSEDIVSKTALISGLFFERSMTCSHCLLPFTTGASVYLVSLSVPNFLEYACLKAVISPGAEYTRISIFLDCSLRLDTMDFMNKSILIFMCETRVCERIQQACVKVCCVRQFLCLD